MTKLRPAAGPIQGGTPVRVLGSGFVQTGEICICVRMRGVEQRVPAAFISEGEVRFMLPTSDFQEAGEARVQLSLNGQQFDAGEPLSFQYHHAVQCTRTPDKEDIPRDSALATVSARATRPGSPPRRSPPRRLGAERAGP